MQQDDALAGDRYRQYVAARDAAPGDAIGLEDGVYAAEVALNGDVVLPDDVQADASGS
jgi:hypothetical protein